MPLGFSLNVEADRGGEILVLCILHSLTPARGKMHRTFRLVHWSRPILFGLARPLLNFQPVEVVMVSDEAQNKRVPFGKHTQMGYPDSSENALQTAKGLRNIPRNVYIGTSGWVYKEWANDFYKGLKAKEHFHFYATQFPTVEINATFYRLPALTMVRGWYGKAPDDFIFAVKGSRFITHIKRLNNLGRGVANFAQRIRPLKEKLGPLLWQLPPNFKPDLPRLARFLKRLPKNFRHAVEFRHPDWFSDETFALLRKYNAASVSMSSLRMPMNFTVTANFVYLRFHGLAGGPQHDYSEAELEPWARHIRDQAKSGKNVYVYFNNDLNVRAPNNAKLLMKMCGEFVVQPATTPGLPNPSLSIGVLQD